MNYEHRIETLQQALLAVITCNFGGFGTCGECTARINDALYGSRSECENEE